MALQITAIKRSGYFIFGLILIFIIFLGQWLGAEINVEWSLAYLLVVFYLLWVGIKGKNTHILGGVASFFIVLGYWVFTDPFQRTFSNFSDDFIVLFSVWIVIYFTYRQKKYVEIELKDKERLNAMFENATEGILVVNQNGSIIMVNQYAEELFGYQREELIGEKLEKLVPNRFASRHSDFRDKYYTDPHNRPMGMGKDLYALHKDQYEFPVEISLGYFKDDDEVTVIAFINNITRRKKIEEQLLKEKELTQTLNQELEERVEERTRALEVALNNLEENNRFLKLMENDLTQALEKERDLGELKSRFVTMASHEFRTPLSTILSSVFLLENYSSEQFQQTKDLHFKRIKRSAKNLTTILNDFLSLSKLEEGRINASYEIIDISSCILEIIEEMENILKPEQKIHFSCIGTEKEFYIDKQFLKTILINLISNAIKFSPANGIIDLVSIIEPEQLLLKVIDKGIGIPEQEQKHLFNRFFRAHNALNIEGTGLGLNIIKKYVEILNGTISLESQLGVGTKFIISIPAQGLPLPEGK